jgi:hypothetical protein
MRALLLAAVLAACGGGSGGDDDVDIPACTPEEQGVVGTPVTFQQTDYEEPSGDCQSLLISSTTELEAHFNGSPPASLATIDFAVDRLYLGISNPGVQFVIDTGGTLVIGEEPFCQGAAPNCVAYTLENTTGDATMIQSCPYRGPDPCLAP